MTLVIADELVESLCRDHLIYSKIERDAAAHVEQLDRELERLIDWHPVAACGPYRIVRCTNGCVVLTQEEAE